jgi:hypothetical protein
MRKPTTLHLEEELLQVLRIHAATSSESISDYANRALRAQLADDLETHRRTARRFQEEKAGAVSLENALKQLEARGLI